MKFLVLILAVVPIYATGDAVGDLLGQEFQHAPIDHIREKRQAQSPIRPFNEAPPYVKQLLLTQNSRSPSTFIPAPTFPKLGPSQPIQPQVVPQSQISQYRPQIINAGAGQQPNYMSLPFNPNQYKKPIYPQQPQYRPLPAYYNQQAEPNYNAPQQQQYIANLPPQLEKLLQYQQDMANGGGRL